MKERIAYFDVAKALAIFLVALGHVVVTYDTRTYGSPFAQYIYSFHTALFMFLSGYFFASSLKKKFMVLLKEKSRQLLLPYLCWSVVALWVIQVPENGMENISSTIMDYLRGGFLRYFWYFKLLFLYIIVTYASIRIVNNKWIGTIISYALFTVLPGFSFSDIFIPFFLAGFLCREPMEKFDGWGTMGILFILDIALYVFWQSAYNYTGLDMSLIPYLIRTGIGIITSILIILLIKKSVNYLGGARFRAVSYVGTMTLGIYACHELFYSKVLWGWMFRILPQNSEIIFVGWALLAVILSLGLVMLISKGKYTSLFFLGKKLSTDGKS